MKKIIYFILFICWHYGNYLQAQFITSSSFSHSKKLDSYFVGARWNLPGKVAPFHIGGGISNHTQLLQKVRNFDEVYFERSTHQSFKVTLGVDQRLWSYAVIRKPLLPSPGIGLSLEHEIPFTSNVKSSTRVYGKVEIGIASYSKAGLLELMLFTKVAMGERTWINGIEVFYTWQSQADKFYKKIIKI